MDFGVTLLLMLASFVSFCFAGWAIYTRQSRPFPFMTSADREEQPRTFRYVVGYWFAVGTVSLGMASKYFW